MKKIHLILAAAALVCTATLTGCVSAQSQTLASNEIPVLRFNIPSFPLTQLQATKFKGCKTLPCLALL